MLDLTLPTSTATLRAVLSAALRRLARDLGRMRPPASPAIAASFEQVRRVFGRELERDAGLAFAILRRPNVGASLRVLRGLGPDAPQDRVDGLTAALSATLAVELAHAGVDLTVRFPTTPSQVVCLGGRFALPGGGPATLRDGTWSLTATSIGTIDLTAPPLGRFHPVEGAIVLATVDDNPLAMVEAHPDKAGNRVDLGGRPVGVWLDALRDALDRVRVHLPIVRDEIDLVLHQIMPVGADDEAHLSASYREAVGTVYLTLHPSAMTMTEALIHEVAHNKLNAALELDPLLTNAFAPLFPSPLRPDPRPLHGVLLAVHAFLPVAALYRAMIEQNDPLASSDAFRARYRAIVEKNRAGAAVLRQHARPTATGRPLLEEIARLDASFT